MSDLAVHEQQCLELLGQPFTAVHQFMDQNNDPEKYPYSAHLHRQYWHHFDVFLLIRQMFGPEATAAARIHILEDCLGYIPHRTDYETGVVDEYGRPKDHELVDTHWYEKLLEQKRTQPQNTTL